MIALTLAGARLGVNARAAPTAGGDEGRARRVANFLVNAANTSERLYHALRFQRLPTQVPSNCDGIAVT